MSWNFPDRRWQAYYQPQPSVLLLWMKSQILWETYLDSLPDSSLCISEKTHKLPGPLCQSHLHSLTGFHLNLLWRSRHLRFTKMIKCRHGRCSWDNETFLTGGTPFYTRPFTRHKASANKVNYHSISISLRFSLGEPKPEGRGTSSATAGWTGTPIQINQTLIFALSSMNVKEISV